MNMYSFIFTCNFIYIWFCCVSRYFSGFFFSFVLVVLCISVGRKLGREITSHLTCTQQAKSLLLFIIVSLSAACDSHTHTHDARRRTWCWQWWRWQQCRRRRQFRCCSCCGSSDFMSVLYICYKTQHDMSWHSHSAYILVASARLDPNNKAHTHTRLHHLHYGECHLLRSYFLRVFVISFTLSLSASFRRGAFVLHPRNVYGRLCHRTFSIGAINKNHVVHQSKRSIKSSPRSDSERKNGKIISFHTFSVSVYFCCCFWLIGVRAKRVMPIIFTRSFGSWFLGFTSIFIYLFHDLTRERWKNKRMVRTLMHVVFIVIRYMNRMRTHAGKCSIFCMYPTANMRRLIVVFDSLLWL